MRKNIFLSVFLFVICFLSYSCEGDDLEYESAFKQSYNSWLDFKSKSGNSYQYTTTGGSWVGVSWEITTVVDEGKIIERSFRYTYIAEDIEIEEEDLEWKETGDELNTHDRSTPAITLDEVYDMAKNDWLKKRKKTETFFDTDSNGMISLCGYVEDNCADDCFRGINIKEIKALK